MLSLEYGTPAFLKKIWTIFIRNLFEYSSGKWLQFMGPNVASQLGNYSIIEILILL